METAASINPRNMLPQSPMKTLAGGKLYSRNPEQAPTKEIVIMTANTCPLIMARQHRITEAINVIPPARPSIPSTRLSAFVTASTQKTVIITLALSGRLVTCQNRIWIVLIRMPNSISIDAAMICPENFQFVFRPSMSSRTPSNTMNSPPRIIPVV